MSSKEQSYLVSTFPWPTLLSASDSCFSRASRLFSAARNHLLSAWHPLHVTAVSGPLATARLDNRSFSRPLKPPTHWRNRIASTLLVISTPHRFPLLTDVNSSGWGKSKGELPLLRRRPVLSLYSAPTLHKGGCTLEHTINTTAEHIPPHPPWLHSSAPPRRVIGKPKKPYTHQHNALLSPMLSERKTRCSSYTAEEA